MLGERPAAFLLRAPPRLPVRVPARVRPAPTRSEPRDRPAIIPQRPGSSPAAAPHLSGSEPANRCCRAAGVALAFEGVFVLCSWDGQGCRIFERAEESGLRLGRVRTRVPAAADR